MKLEIEVELPEHIAAEWEVVAVRPAKVGDVVPVATIHGPKVMDMAISSAAPHVILRRKDNPRDWWPQWLTADAITLEINAVIKVRGNSGISAYWHDESGLLDLSWIPGHLRRSGMTIENPWKGE